MSTLTLPDPKQLQAMASHPAKFVYDREQRCRDEVALFMRETVSLVHTEIFVLSGGYVEIACADMYMPVMQRHWHYIRTVDFNRICIQ
jgi:hypothetical protein